VFMPGWVGFVILLLAIILIWPMVTAMLRRPKAGPAGDPEALVGGGLKRPPNSRSGAVALEEPDEDE
jgi:hypothetical protein